jgi:hypothetical protein
MDTWTKEQVEVCDTPTRLKTLLVDSSLVNESDGECQIERFTQSQRDPSSTTCKSHGFREG